MTTMPQGRSLSPDALKTYCSILGIPETATSKELRDAFHKKASSFHPDTHPGDTMAAEMFKKVNNAYQHLKKHFRDRDRHADASKMIVKAPSTATTASITGAPVTTQAPGIPADELALRLRHSDNKYVRLHAVRAIAEQCGREGCWLLVAALNDTDRDVVAESVKALGKLRARVAAMPLIHLHKKTDRPTQILIECSLRQIASPLSQKFIRNTIAGQQQYQQRGSSEIYFSQATHPAAPGRGTAAGRM